MSWFGLVRLITVDEHSKRVTGDGGAATQQRDSTQSREKAQKENPKAPGPIIGMEDERGGKGFQ